MEGGREGGREGGKEGGKEGGRASSIHTLWALDEYLHSFLVVVFRDLGHVSCVVYEDQQIDVATVLGTEARRDHLQHTTLVVTTGSSRE